MNPIWYPFTQMKTAPEPLKVVRGRGSVLELEDGRTLIDCISSWWVNVLGHGHPVIAEAIYEQAKTLEHVIFAGFTHDPAEKLARKLTSLLPPELQKVFFSDNGSTAVEVALKIAYQSFINRGEKRDTFLCFDGAYHGDTIGAMSLGAPSVFNKLFERLLFKKISIPYPATFLGDEDVLQKEQTALDLAEMELSKGEVAAVVVEPLVQGVSGMQMCRPIFLQKLEALARSYGTLVIYDEVMTGFGRTGDWFACKKSQTSPDIICLAKGLTGGFLPLAVTVCTESIFETFYSEDPMKTFFHGHSYTANPLGCAAANATLDLLQKDLSIFMGMEKRHRVYLAELQHIPVFKKIRVCGTIVAMEVIAEGKSGYLHEIGLELRRFFLERGLLIRPLGNVLYLMPPYCITDEELQKIYEAIIEFRDD